VWIALCGPSLPREHPTTSTADKLARSPLLRSRCGGGRGSSGGHVSGAQSIYSRRADGESTCRWLTVAPPILFTFLWYPPTAAAHPPSRRQAELSTPLHLLTLLQRKKQTKTKVLLLSDAAMVDVYLSRYVCICSVCRGPGICTQLRWLHLTQPRRRAVDLPSAVSSLGNPFFRSSGCRISADSSARLLPALGRSRALLPPRSFRRPVGCSFPMSSKNSSCVQNLRRRLSVPGQGRSLGPIAICVHSACNSSRVGCVMYRGQWNSAPGCWDQLGAAHLFRLPTYIPYISSSRTHGRPKA